MGLRCILVVVFGATLYTGGTALSNANDRNGVSSRTTLPTTLAINGEEERVMRQVETKAVSDEERFISINISQWWSSFLEKIMPTLKYNRDRLSRLKAFIKRFLPGGRKEAKLSDPPPSASPAVASSVPNESPPVELPAATKEKASGFFSNWKSPFTWWNSAEKSPASVSKEGGTGPTTEKPAGYFSSLTNWWKPSEKPPASVSKEVGAETTLEKPASLLPSKQMPLGESHASVPKEGGAELTTEKPAGYISTFTNWWKPSEKPPASVSKEVGVETSLEKPASLLPSKQRPLGVSHASVPKEGGAELTTEKPAGYFSYLTDWWKSAEKSPASVSKEVGAETTLEKSASSLSSKQKPTEDLHASVSKEGGTEPSPESPGRFISYFTDRWNSALKSPSFVSRDKGAERTPEKPASFLPSMQKSTEDPLASVPKKLGAAATTSHQPGRFLQNLRTSNGVNLD